MDDLSIQTIFSEILNSDNLPVREITIPPFNIDNEALPNRKFMPSFREIFNWELKP